MNNISDKDAMRKKFENSLFSDNNYRILDLNFNKRPDGSYTNLFCAYAWLAYQAAYESCLSEFEPSLWVDEAGRTIANKCEGYTPLFTRKG